uniref:Uncharacterized protein n=1 Tax=Megaselia scalaris TaxID=36166 RepID=T1H1A8_MEGSC
MSAQYVLSTIKNYRGISLLSLAYIMSEHLKPHVIRLSVHINAVLCLESLRTINFSHSDRSLKRPMSSTSTPTTYSLISVKLMIFQQAMSFSEQWTNLAFLKNSSNSAK